MKITHISTTGFDEASRIRDEPRTFSANNAPVADCQPASSEAPVSVLRFNRLREDNKILQIHLEHARTCVASLLQMSTHLRSRMDMVKVQASELVALVERHENRQDEFLQKNTLLELQLKALRATRKCDDCALMQYSVDVEV